MGMGSFVTFPNHKVGVYENGIYAQITILVRTIIMHTRTQGITIYIYTYIYYTYLENCNNRIYLLDIPKK